MNGLWPRASFCNSGMRVEAQARDGRVYVRNSTGGPVVAFDRSEWEAFVAVVAAGEFNLPEETQQ